MNYEEMYDAIQAMPLEPNKIPSEKEALEKARTRISHIIARVERNYLVALEDYREAEAKLEDNWYEEDFEDTLERKYAEGYADALGPLVDTLKAFKEAL